MGKKVESMKEPETKLEEAWQQDREVKRRFLRGWEQCPMSRGLKRPTNLCPAQWQTHRVAATFTGFSGWKPQLGKTEKSIADFTKRGFRRMMAADTENLNCAMNQESLLSWLEATMGFQWCRLHTDLGGLVVGVAVCCGPNCGFSSHWVTTRWRWIRPGRVCGKSLGVITSFKAFLFCIRDTDPISF